MKRIFKSLLLITLALGSTNAFGMERNSLFEESKQVFYTPGTQRSQVMPPASAALTPQAMAGLTLSQAAWQNTDIEGQKGESKEAIKLNHHDENEPRFKLLYDLITTMPPELIRIILDYAKEFEGKHVRTIETNDELSTLIAVSPRIIACLIQDNLTFWNMETGQHIKTIKPFTGYTRIKILPLANEILALGLCDGTIKLLNWKTESIQKTNDKHKHSVIALSKLSDQLFASTDSHEMKLWKSETGQHIKTIDIKTGRGYVVKLVALTQNMIAAATSKGEIKIWNIETGQSSPNELYTPSIPEGGTPYLIMISPKTLAAAVSRNNEIYLFNWETDQQLETIKLTASLSSLELYSNNLLAAGLSNGNIELYDPETGTCKKNFKAHRLAVGMLIAISRNRLASAQRGLASGLSDSKQIRIWE